MNPVNFDALVGPTHNYAGLSSGNLASKKHKNQTANPKLAALQGLEKMKFMASLGIKQGILPPQERPHIPTLKALGFTGKDADILRKVFQEAPEIFSNVCSASSMWAANAATLTPSIDSSSRKVHFTPANLASKLHRSIEVAQTGKILQAIFPDPLYFVHHSPLGFGRYFADEGAANHIRFFKNLDETGIHFFVYGRRALTENALLPQKFAARQTLEAQQAIARLHGISKERVLFAQQSPRAIDAGVFHNDVISVGTRGFFFYHEKSFVAQETIIQELCEKYEKACGQKLKILQVPENKISLNDAVESYLFNSELVAFEEGTYALVAPEECKRIPSVAAYLEACVKDPDNPLMEVHYIALKESMQNGGGPACLRLQVPLNERELSAVHPKALFSDLMYGKLQKWIEKHYRDRLDPKDLQDPKLLQESRAALDELTKIMDLGSLYEFQ